MKDIEKIKSEDLACQVQDANPGNFAIEQEVAQLVGATVPAPTQPSADEARELGAQLLVFLRRALLPIRSALRTAVAAIYAHLDSRCTDYTPAAYAPYSAARRAYDPMGTLPARSVANLLTAITAFSARKISNGSAPNDGIKDGVSLAHLLCSTDAANSVTEIVDDNYGWVMDKHILWSAFTNLQKIQLLCIAASKDMGSSLLNSIFSGTANTLLIPELVRMTVTGGNKSFSGLINMANLTNLDADKLEYYEAGLLYGCNSLEEADLKNLKRAGTFVAYNCANLKRISADELETCADYSYYPSLIGNLPELRYASFKKVSSLNMFGTTGVGGTLQNMPKLEELHIGKCNAFSGGYAVACFSNCPMLIKLVIYGDLNTNINMAGWNPTDKGTTFLQNFKEHIALRLTSNGSGKTLTLSQAVRDAIHAAEATYGIEAIIVTQKGWTLSPAPTA